MKFAMSGDWRLHGDLGSIDVGPGEERETGNWGLGVVVTSPDERGPGQINKL